MRIVRSFATYERSSHLRVKCSGLLNCWTVAKIKLIKIAALVHTSFDCGNFILVGSPAYRLRLLQSVLNAAARLTFRLRRYDHVTDAQVVLHWLRGPRARRLPARRHYVSRPPWCRSVLPAWTFCNVKAHSHRGRQRTSPRRASMLCTDLGENAQASLHVFDFQHRRASMLLKDLWKRRPISTNIRTNREKQTQHEGHHILIRSKNEVQIEWKGNGCPSEGT